MRITSPNQEFYPDIWDVVMRHVDTLTVLEIDATDPNNEIFPGWTEKIGGLLEAVSQLRTLNLSLRPKRAPAQDEKRALIWVSLSLEMTAKLILLM